jgi:hypothetical protein
MSSKDRRNLRFLYDDRRCDYCFKIKKAFTFTFNLVTNLDECAECIEHHNKFSLDKIKINQTYTLTSNYDERPKYPEYIEYYDIKILTNSSNIKN